MARRKREARPATISRSRRHSTSRNRSGDRVLLCGQIRELALYRAEVLHSHGFAVSTPADKEEAVAAIRRGHFDVVILTYTLSSTTVQELAELTREYCPQACIIAISNSKKEDRQIDPDEIVLADDGPRALIAALRKLTRRK